MKTLKCSDAGFDCAAVVNAERVAEVLAQAAAHAQGTHGVAATVEIAGEIAKKITG